MNLRIVAYQVPLEIRRYMRDRMGAFWTFAFPFLMLALFMWMYGGDRYGLTRAYLVTGMVAMTVLATCLFGFAVVLVELRARDVFRMFHLFPIRPVEFLVAFVASRIAILVGFCVVFLLVAHAVYGLPLRADPWQWAAIVLALTLGSVTFLAVGLALSSRLASVAAANGLANLLYFPLIAFSDLFYPQQALPEWLATVVNFVPLAGLVAALRAVIAPQVDTAGFLATLPGLLGWTAVSLAIAVPCFRWRNPRSA